MKGIWTGLVVVLLVSFTANPISMQQISHVPIFSGIDAYEYLVDQCDFGPRPPGSDNLSLCRTMIAETFESFGWNVTFQNFTYQEVDCVNIIVRWNSQSDSIEIVLFDAEDSGGISGWSWIQGSTYYVAQLSTERRESIHAMVLLDMVGDINLVLPRERSSTTSLQNTIWSIADQLGHNETFIDSYGGSITDDHQPFLDADIHAVDLIQMPFPSTWHTLEDTPDRCSAESLEIVGEVIEVFVVEEADSFTEFPLDSLTPLLIGVVVVVALTIPLLYTQLKRK